MVSHYNVPVCNMSSHQHLILMDQSNRSLGGDTGGYLSYISLISLICVPLKVKFLCPPLLSSPSSGGSDGY